MQNTSTKPNGITLVFPFRRLTHNDSNRGSDGQLFSHGYLFPRLFASKTKEGQMALYQLAMYSFDFYKKNRTQPTLRATAQYATWLLGLLQSMSTTPKFACRSDKMIFTLFGYASDSPLLEFLYVLLSGLFRCRTALIHWINTKFATIATESKNADSAATTTTTATADDTKASPEIAIEFDELINTSTVLANLAYLWSNKKTVGNVPRAREQDLSGTDLLLKDDLMSKENVLHLAQLVTGLIQVAAEARNVVDAVRSLSSAPERTLDIWSADEHVIRASVSCDYIISCAASPKRLYYMDAQDLHDRHAFRLQWDSVPQGSPLQGSRHKGIKEELKSASNTCQAIRLLAAAIHFRAKRNKGGAQACIMQIQTKQLRSSTFVACLVSEVMGTDRVPKDIKLPAFESIDEDITTISKLAGDQKIPDPIAAARNKSLVNVWCVFDDFMPGFALPDFQLASVKDIQQDIATKLVKNEYEEPEEEEEQEEQHEDDF